MCNLYSITRGQQAIRELTGAMIDRTGNLPPLPCIFPDYGAPIVRDGKEGRELALARWGMPSPLFALKGKKVDRGVTNVRNAGSPHWGGGGLAHRTAAWSRSPASPRIMAPGGTREPIWFAFDEDRPLAFFAGIWTNWTSVRKVKEGEVTADLFAFLTTDANAEVGRVHPQAMSAILTTEDERETWLRAPWSEACNLQRPLPDGSLRIVLTGEKQDGVWELVDLAAQASRAHAAMPLPLFEGAMDEPHDAAAVARIENKHEN